MNWLRKLGSLSKDFRRRRQAKRWEHKWDTVEHPFRWELEAEAPSIVRSVNDGWLTPGTTVLDIGCGLGYNAAWLVNHNFKVLGIDVSSAAIDKARCLHSEREGLKFQQCDVTAQENNAEFSFDAIIDRGCLHGIPKPLWDSYVRNIALWLKPDGRMLLLMALFETSKSELTANMRNLFHPHFEIANVASISLSKNKTTEPLPGLEFQLVKSHEASC